MPPAPIYKGNTDGSDGWTKRAGFEGESARDAGLMLGDLPRSSPVPGSHPWAKAWAAVVA
jgi:hypothetical protein